MTEEITPTSPTSYETNLSSKLIDTKVADEEKPIIPPKSEAGEPEEKKVRSKEERQRSFKFIMGYARRECCSISLGIIFLVGGSLSDLTMPYFIGKIIDFL